METKLKINLEKIDKICDYIPIISTVSNLTDLFQKHVLLNIPGIKSSSIPKKDYFVHIQSKDSFRSVALLIPIIGNVIIAIGDWRKMRCNSISEKSLELARKDQFIDAIDLSKTIPIKTIRDSTHNELHRIMFEKFLKLAYAGKSSEAMELANRALIKIATVIHGDDIKDIFLSDFSKIISEESIRVANDDIVSAIKITNTIPVKEIRDSTHKELYPIIDKKTIEFIKSGRLSEAMFITEKIRTQMFDKTSARFKAP